MSSSRIDRPPLKLFFATPEFRDGDVIQTTVRVGPKWRDDLKGSYRPRVPVFITDLESDGSIGTAEITGDLFGSFKNYAEIGSKSNHQKNCRTVKGLAEVLAECYPDFDPETSQVTILFFKFTPTEVVEETAEETVEETTDETTTEESSDGSTEETEGEKADTSSEEGSSEESSSETGESSES